MTESSATAADKTAEQLRAEFLAVYDKAEAIREKLELLILELEAHGLAFDDLEDDNGKAACPTVDVRDQKPLPDNNPPRHMACEEGLPSTDGDGA